MYLFLFILLPAALYIYFNSFGEKSLLTLSFTGLITGVIVCGIRFLFFFSHRIIDNSFFSNYLFYLVRIVLLPLLVYVVFFLISRDSIELKLKAFFPLMAGFYVTYLPYYFLTMSGSVYSNYDLFLRPVLYFAYLYGTCFALLRMYKSFVDKKQLGKILYILMVILYLLIPAAIDASYIINVAYGFFVVICVFYIVLPVVLLLLEKLKKVSE